MASYDDLIAYLDGNGIRYKKSNTGIIVDNVWKIPDVQRKAEDRMRYVITDSKGNILARTDISLADDLARHIAFLNPNNPAILTDYDNNDVRVYLMTSDAYRFDLKKHKGSQEMPHRPGIKSGNPRPEDG